MTREDLIRLADEALVAQRAATKAIEAFYEAVERNVRAALPSRPLILDLVVLEHLGELGALAETASVTTRAIFLGPVSICGIHFWRRDEAKRAMEAIYAGNTAATPLRDSYAQAAREALERAVAKAKAAP